MTMRSSVEELHTRLIVRRVGTGARPFSWGIYGAPDGSDPIHASSDRYASMEAAFAVGSAWMAEHLLTKATSKKGRVRSEIVQTEIAQLATNDDDEFDDHFDVAPGRKAFIGNTSSHQDWLKPDEGHHLIG